MRLLATQRPGGFLTVAAVAGETRGGSRNVAATLECTSDELDGLRRGPLIAANAAEVEEALAWLDARGMWIVVRPDPAIRLAQGPGEAAVDALEAAGFVVDYNR